MGKQQQERCRRQDLSDLWGDPAVRRRRNCLSRGANLESHPARPASEGQG
jgi:hypothetical protein